MVKLVIQIPCFNEEETLPLVLKELPKKIEGVAEVEWQIIDDGSTDNTVEVAREYGCHVVSYVGNKGLGNAFKAGISEALSRGADIVVNTDGDNQYPSAYIKDLVKPILDGRADIVIGDRQTKKVEHFSPLKKFLQWFGSLTVRRLSGTDVADTVSGFRAYSKEALMQLNVVSKFSYCLDTIVQAGKKNLTVVDIKMSTNAPTRKSRLFKNMFQHIKKSGMNLIQVYVMYEPFKTFFYLSLPFLFIGLVLFFRYAYYFVIGEGGGHIQSLVIGTVFFITGVISVFMGIISHLLAINRRLLEENLYLEKVQVYGKFDKIRPNNRLVGKHSTKKKRK
ncbi:MAG: glycosyltransferase family 2 protein [Nanoarchaeota archaeon]